MNRSGRIITPIVLALCSISDSVFSQIPVAKEPHHKNVFENKYLRILDVRIVPGDTTLYHRHSLPSAIVFFSSTRTSSQILGDNSVDGHSVSGETLFAAFGEKPIIHRVWNRDSVVYHVMDIELLSSAKIAPESQPKRKEFTLAWDQNLARAYKIKVESNSSLPELTGTTPMLLLCISGSELAVSWAENPGRVKKLLPGKFLWIKPGQKVQLKNQGNSITNCILIELK